MSINNTILTIRRYIGDYDSTSYLYSNTVLYGYIQDAITELGYSVTISGNEYTSHVSDTDSYIIALKSSILIKIQELNKADRDNFLLKKGRLTIDNRNQSGNHIETIRLLENKLENALKKSKYENVQGVRLE